MGALDGKVAIITGAATGIGRASAMLFTRAGARVVVADMRDDELAKTAAAVRDAGGTVSAIVADLAQPEACRTVVETAVHEWGRLDVLFNNAGVGTMVVGGTVETIDLDRWDLAHDVNVRAIYLEIDPSGADSRDHDPDRGGGEPIRNQKNRHFRLGEHRGYTPSDKGSRDDRQPR